MANTSVLEASDSQVPLTLLHPIDCLETRLRLVVFHVIPLWGQAVSVFEPGMPAEYQAYSLFEHDCTEAQRSLDLAGSAATGIGQWLKPGMVAEGLSFETRLREAISRVRSAVSCPSTLKGVVLFAEDRCSMQVHVDFLEGAPETLHNVARDSHPDANEWQRELGSLRKVLVSLIGKMEDLQSASRDVTADLDTAYGGARSRIAEVESVVGTFTRKQVFGIFGDPRGVYIDTLAADTRDYADALFEWGRANRSGTEGGTFEPPKHLEGFVADV